MSSTIDPAVIVNVSLATSDRDYTSDVTFSDMPFRLMRLGTDGDVNLAAQLVRDWADSAAAIAVTGIREARAAGLYDGDIAAVDKVRKATDAVPVADGHALRDVLQEWAIREVNNEMPGYFINARVLVLGSGNHERAARSLGEYTENIEFADPLLRLDIPGKLNSNVLLGIAADVSLWPLRKLPGFIQSQIKAPGAQFSSLLARRGVADKDVIVGSFEEIESFGFESLAGKCVVTSAVSDERLAYYKALDVDMVLDYTPQPFEDVTINAATLEAMMKALTSGASG